MQIFGKPDQELLNYAVSWINQCNDGEVEALIFPYARLCLMVGTVKGKHPWVAFWNPQNQSTKKIFNPTQWYDWESLPKNQKPQLLKSYKQCCKQIDVTALREITPFSNGR